MKKQLLFAFACHLWAFSAFAQPKFEFRNPVVTKNGASLQNAWAGGLNAAVINTMPLNNDGIDDLVIFDRNTYKISTFLAVNSGGGVTYTAAPEYEYYFPADLNNWVRFADYDCDGLKDIFTASPLGVAIYHNTTQAGNPPDFTKLLDEILIPSQSGGGRTVNLQISNSDLPEVIDYDHDGDLDILAIFFSGITMVEYQNMSMERTGRCGLDFVGNYSCFGRFLLATGNCGQYQTGQSCRLAAPGPGNPDTVKRVMHNGTSSTFAHISSDSLYDLLMGDASCNSLYYLQNTGTRQNAVYAPAITFAPGNETASFYTFPAAYATDVDRDGLTDLIVVPNTPSSSSGLSNFAQSLWYYRNTGSAQHPAYALTARDWLQNTMIEVGEEAAPALADYDADGDLDLFIGDKGRDDGVTETGGITLYRNTGSRTAPVFEYVTNNYLGLRSMRLNTIRPSFTDMNGDGRPDLIVVSSTFASGNNYRYFLNNAAAGNPYSFDTAALNSLPVATDPYDYPVFYDLDNDGFPDMLLGKYDGSLQYFRNIGSLQNPSYQLVTASACGIGANTGGQNLTLSIADFDFDGNLDLLTGDYSGLIRWYSNFIPKLLATTAAAETTLIYNTLGELKLPYQFGGYPAPAAADLDADGYPDLILGTQGGGLMYLRNTTPYPSGTEKPKPRDDIFNLAPNPSTGILHLTLKGKGSLSIWSVTGQEVFAGNLPDSLNYVTLNLSNIPNGLYMVQAHTDSISETKKLVINR